MRVFIALLFLTALSFAATWVVDNDGAILINWLGYRIETTVAFFIFAVLFVSLCASVIFYTAIWLYSAPLYYRKALLERRREKGLVALTEGFAAVAAGDIKQAKSLTKKAQSSLGSIGITKLLSAQAANLEGNKLVERQQYTAMLEDEATEIIAIKGLLLAAKEDGNLDQAVELAEKAVSLQEDADWAYSILFDLYKRTQQWHKASEVLENLLRYKVIDKKHYKYLKAIIALSTGIMLDKQGFIKESVYSFSLSYKELPDFVPAIISYAAALVKNDQQKKAIKVLESGWKKIPHISIAEQYMELFNGQTGDKRIKQSERLYQMNPTSMNGHIIVAKTALHCGDLNKARNHLKLALAEEETKLICQLMGELETMENSSQDIIQKWYKRANQASDKDNWSCVSCGNISESWHPNCNNCQEFNSYKWNSSKEVNVTPFVS